MLIRRPLPLPGQTEPPELKYYLSNAPADTPLAELIRVCGMRWPIECCFEEGKGQVGMDHYELRFWRGWYHPMTLVILAHHFLVRLRLRQRQRLMGCDAALSASSAAPAPAIPGGPPEGERGPAPRAAADTLPEDVPWPLLALLAPPCPPAPQFGGRALLAPSCASAARAGCAGRLGMARLPAPARGRRLPLPPQAPPGAPPPPPSTRLVPSKSRCRASTRRTNNSLLPCKALTRARCGSWSYSALFCCSMAKSP